MTLLPLFSQTKLKLLPTSDVLSWLPLPRSLVSFFLHVALVLPPAGYFWNALCNDDLSNYFFSYNKTKLVLCFTCNSYWWLWEPWLHFSPACTYTCAHKSTPEQEAALEFSLQPVLRARAQDQALGTNPEQIQNSLTGKLVNLECMSRLKGVNCG